MHGVRLHGRELRGREGRRATEVGGDRVRYPDLYPVTGDGRLGDLVRREERVGSARVGDGEVTTYPPDRLP